MVILMETLFSIFILGLVLLVVAWVIQFSQVKKGNKEVNKYFLITYSIGLLLIVVDGLMQGLILAPILNLLALLLILAVLIKTNGKTKK